MNSSIPGVVQTELQFPSQGPSSAQEICRRRRLSGHPSTPWPKPLDWASDFPAVESPTTNHTQTHPSHLSRSESDSRSRCSTDSALASTPLLASPIAAPGRAPTASGGEEKWQRNRKCGPLEFRIEEKDLSLNAWIFVSLSWDYPNFFVAAKLGLRRFVCSTRGCVRSSEAWREKMALDLSTPWAHCMGLEFETLFLLNLFTIRFS